MGAMAIYQQIEVWQAVIIRVLPRFHLVPKYNFHLYRSDIRPES